MLNRIKARTVSLLAMLALLLGAAVGIGATPAMAVNPPCHSNTFCLSASAGAPFIVEFSASTPRNTCEDGWSATGTNFATEGTGVQWWLFRTTTCGGSHIVVHANTNLTLPAGWAGAIVAVMRTSTVG